MPIRQVRTGRSEAQGRSAPPCGHHVWPALERDHRSVARQRNPTKTPTSHRASPGIN